jgi:hypothetical protein
VRVALATCAAFPDGWSGDLALVPALEAAGAEPSIEVWDDARVDWSRFDRVVVRWTFDYTRKRDDFLGWAESLGDRVRNPLPILRWSSDKSYLGDLAGEGLAVVPTQLADPGGRPPELSGEVVVKPSISAGGRDTGRFGPSRHDDALALLEHIRASGRTALVQPYLRDVDEHGETAQVFIAGELSHVLRKRAVLRPDEIAPTADDALGSALAMYDDDLVRAGDATDAERETGRAIIDSLTRRFGTPLYCRVDLLRGPDGHPVLLELDAVEPALYLAEAPGAAEWLAAAVVAS